MTKMDFEYLCTRGGLSYRSTQMAAHASTEGMDRHVSLFDIDTSTSGGDQM